MNRSKILLASVLKPVDDTRMFEKLGLALAKIDKAEIHIAGFATRNVAVQDNIEFHPIFNFNRLSSQRLFTSWKLWQLLIQLKPEAIIVNTHELLIVICLYKILFGAHLIYDVQENYFKNLWYGKQFLPGIRHILAVYVRLKERTFKPFIESFILAEQCYLQEMPFLSSRAIVIENKFRITQNTNMPVERDRIPLRLIYTGTIADIYGIFEVIQIAKSLLNEQPGTFTIVGHCPNKRLLGEVKRTISDDSRIRLIADEKPLPHTVILEEIVKSNLGIMSYKPNPAIQNRTPTRVFEYMACKLPFLFPDHVSWARMAHEYNAGIAVSFKSFNAKEVLDSYTSSVFFNTGDPDNLHFESYDHQLQKLILELIS